MSTGTNLSIAKLTMIRRLNFAPQLRRHGLHTIANPQDRNTQFKDDLRRTWSVTAGHGFRATRQNNAFGTKFTNVLIAAITGIDFTVNADFPNAASNQLSILRAEIQDQNPVGMNIGRMLRIHAASL